MIILATTFILGIVILAKGIYEKGKIAGYESGYKAGYIKDSYDVGSSL